MRINGQIEDGAPRPLPRTLGELLAARGIDPAARYLAVAVNGAIVPRGEWPSLALAEADDVEIVRPREGG
jgi:sulfur carrier protein